MTIVKIHALRWLMLFCFFGAGCVRPAVNTPALPVVVGVGAPAVIIPVEVARSDNHLSALYQSFWFPSKEVVGEAEQRLRGFLESEKHNATGYSGTKIPDILENLGQYRRQYVGVVVDGEQRILFNVLTREQHKYSDWRQHYVYLIEGASDCWRVEYLVSSRQYTNFNASFGY